MSNETYWALKQREWAAREQRPTRRNRRLNVPLRGPQRAVAAPAAPIPAEVLEETAAEVEPEYGGALYTYDPGSKEYVPETDEPEEPKAKPKKAKAG